MPPTQHEHVWLSSLAQAETLLASLAEQLNHPESTTALTASNYQTMLQLTSLLQHLASGLPHFSQAQLLSQVEQRLAKLQATHTALIPRLSHWQDYVEQQQHHVAKQRQQQQAYKCL
jgi:hypothetical protein